MKIRDKCTPAYAFHAPWIKPLKVWYWTYGDPPLIISSMPMNQLRLNPIEIPPCVIFPLYE